MLIHIPRSILLILLLSFTGIQAQDIKPGARPMDSATLSKIISQQVKDTGSGKSTLKISDTSVAVIINRLESYTLMLNQVMSTLKRGLDTAGISENLPLIDSSLLVIKRDIASLGSTPNVHDIYTNRVLLLQLEWRLDRWQDNLFKYYDRLVNISDTLQLLRKDTAMRNIPAEDQLRDIYVGQMATLIGKWRQVDSANKRNLLYLGLLQNKVASRYIESTNLLEDMDFQLSSFSSRMFNKDFSYLWEPPLPDKKGPKFTQVLSHSLRKNIRVLEIFYAVRRPLFFIWLLAGIAFLWWIRFNTRKIRLHHEPTEAESILQHSKYLYRHPIASAILLVATFTSLLSIQYPILYAEIAWGITVLSASFIIRENIPVHIFKRWLFLVFLLAIYCMNNLLIQATFAEQWGLFAGAILSITLGAYLLQSLRNTTLPLPKYSRSAIWLFIIMSSFSLLLVIIARVTAAKIIGAASVVNITMALGIVLMVEILMEAIYLQVEANKDSSTFISLIDYQNIKSKLKTFFYIIATIGWLVLMARNLYIYEAIYDFVSEFLSAERKIGNITFSFSSVIIFLLIIWVSTVITQIISYLMGYTGKSSQPRKGLGSAILLIRLAVLGAGTLLAFAASGIPMDKVAIVIGALGVGIGFGLQNIVNNLVSGVILAFEKPIEVGDVIELGTRSGVVKEIGIRSSKISAGDGSEVIVPNGELIAQQLVNWTVNNRTRKIDLPVGVAYGSDIKTVSEILKKCIKEQEGVLEVPEPVVLLANFRDNAIDFLVSFWISDLGQAGTLKSAILIDTYSQLQQAGIKIAHPSPQQVEIRMGQDVYRKEENVPPTGTQPAEKPADPLIGKQADSSEKHPDQEGI